MKAKKDYLKQNTDGTVTITLVKGYTPTGTNSAVQEMTMREPMVRDQQAARLQGGGDDADMELALLASLTGVTPQELAEMTSRDYQRVQQAYGFFMD